MVVRMVAVGCGVVSCAVRAAFRVGAVFAYVSVLLAFVASNWFL